MDATKDVKEDKKMEELIQEVKEAPVEDVKSEDVKSEDVKSEDVKPEDAKSEDVKPVTDEKAAQQQATAPTDEATPNPSPNSSAKDTSLTDPAFSVPSTVTPATEEPSAGSSVKSPEAAAATVTAAAVTAAAAAAKEVVAEAAAAPHVVAQETSKTAQVEDYSDPDEDDLDDLDDMLEEFSAAKIDTKKPAEAISSTSDASKNPTTSAKQPVAEDDFSEEEFAKQLQAGMADLLGELEGSRDMQSQFEDIFKQIAAAEGTDDAPPAPNAKAGSAPQPTAEDASFQETIRKTMERMQASGDQATAAAASGAGDDFMSEMFKQMSSGGMGDLGGEGSEEEFSKMLMGMMEQLTNKEILYEPMKELDQKFPEWLKKNRDKTAKEDLERYEEQQSVVREIVAKFEEKTYSDSNTADREFIVDRMQKMQAAGSPPADLVGDMPSAQDALNPSDEACNPQ